MTWSDVGFFEPYPQEASPQAFALAVRLGFRASSMGDLLLDALGVFAALPLTGLWGVPRHVRCAHICGLLEVQCRLQNDQA